MRRAVAVQVCFTTGVQPCVATVMWRRCSGTCPGKSREPGRHPAAHHSPRGGALVAGGILASFITAAVELSATILLVSAESQAPMSYGIFLYMQSVLAGGRVRRWACWRSWW